MRTLRIDDRVAYLLAIWPDEIVARSIARASLPVGHRRSPKRNNISDVFIGALTLFEKRGWILRGEVFVKILDRDGLWEYCHFQGGDPESADLPVHAMVAQARADLEEAAAERLLEQRRRQLKAVQRLMVDYQGYRAQKHPVRLLPRSQTL